MRTLAERLKIILERRAKDERDLVPQAVKGRNSVGTLKLRPQDGECVLRGAISANYTGQVVHEPPSPAFDRRGLGGSTLNASSSGGTLWIEKLEPSALPRGSTLTVTVFGRGFTSSTRLDFAERGFTRILNPDVRILKQTLIDSSRIDLEIEVAEDARLLEDGALMYDR